MLQFPHGHCSSSSSLPSLSHHTSQNSKTSINKIAFGHLEKKTPPLKNAREKKRHKIAPAARMPGDRDGIHLTSKIGSMENQPERCDRRSQDDLKENAAGGGVCKPSKNPRDLKKEKHEKKTCFLLDRPAMTELRLVFNANNRHFLCKVSKRDCPGALACCEICCASKIACCAARNQPRGDSCCAKTLIMLTKMLRPRNGVTANQCPAYCTPPVQPQRLKT